MKTSLRAFGSLRFRITLAMLALAAVGSSIFAVGIYMGAERLEQSVLDRHVRAEFETLASDLRANPGVDVVRSALLLGFVGADNPGLPPEFARLGSGDFHAVRVGDKAYQVYVGDADGRRLYVAYDITEWEALEQPVIATLIAGVVLSSVLAIVLGIWISSQVIAPVTALSERVRGLDPRVRQVRIAPEFRGAEVSVIAEAFDRFMQRLDGFVEREQLFTSAAAHELRTPLAVIQGATDVLDAQGDMPPAARRATARLERATRDMREFIDALLLLSREDARESYESASCDVGQILRQVAEDSQALVEDRPIRLETGTIDPVAVAVPPALPTIVISNLVRNAAENTESGSIRLTLEEGVLSVADTGRGIDAAAREVLFERDFSTKERGGLGLHLTKRVCDQLGWSLAVSSVPGSGTTVSVDFRPAGEPA